MQNKNKSCCCNFYLCKIKIVKKLYINMILALTHYKKHITKIIMVTNMDLITFEKFYLMFKAYMMIARL